MNVNSLLLTQLSVTPWAVHPGMLDVFSQVVNNKMEGFEIKPSQEVKDYEKKINYQIVDGKAIIPLHGTFMKRTFGMKGMSGFVPTINAENTLYDAMVNSKVKEIILDIDSPGGTVAGAFELADLIYEMRGEKSIVSYGNGMMCSAAYLVGAAASKAYTYTTCQIGSIGVVLMHIDQSKANEAEGLSVTFVQAGKYKTMGNPYEPLNDEASAELQKQVDHTYDLFVEKIALFRDKEVAYVRENMAEGRIFRGEDAVKVGLVDKIINFQGLVDPSNTYSFLKGGTEMAFGKNIESLTAEELLEKNPSLYNTLVDSGKAELQAEVEQLKADNAQLKAQIEETEKKRAENEKIRDFSSKLGVSEAGEKCISEGMSVTEAYEAIAQAAADKANDAQNAFEATAPPAAGTNSADEMDAEEPTNGEQAKAYVQKRDGSTNGKAWMTARKEFPQFFGKEGK